MIAEYLDETYPGPAAAAKGAQGARPRPLAGGIRRHAARRRVHLGPVLPEDGPSPRVGRARRSGADRQVRWPTDIPAALDYLEGELPEDGFLFGEMGLADISIASFFRNASYAGFSARRLALATHVADSSRRCSPTPHSKRSTSLRRSSCPHLDRGAPPGAA